MDGGLTAGVAILWLIGSGALPATMIIRREGRRGAQRRAWPHTTEPIHSAIQRRRCTTLAPSLVRSVRSLPCHLDRSMDGILEIVRVMRCGLVSIAKIHAVAARAHLPQSESEMARNRFGLGERHRF